MTKILGGDSYSFFSTDKRYGFIILSTHIIPNYPDPQR
jgi:serine phosphatase RsbU (regulator of sigma subunit)